MQNLLAGQIVDRREVFTAWAHKQDFQDPRALWRVLTDVQGTNSSRIFRAVARYYSFQEAHISMVGTQTLVIQNRNLFTDLEWRRMVELGVFPVREKNDALDDGVRWTFASFDPSKNAVRTFVSSTSRGRSFLKYAPLATLFEVVNNCTGFPKLDALPWYRKYVLGRLPISLRPLPDSGDVRRAA